MSRPASGTVAWKGNPPRWFARVTTKDEHGNVVRPWVDLERPDLRNTPEDKKIAKTLARKRAKLAKKGVYVGAAKATAPRVTVADLEDKWFDLLDGDSHTKSGTKTAYKSCYTSRILPTFGAVPVVDLKVPALRAWIRELCEELSPSSVRNIAIAFTRFISDAKAEGWIQIDTNPMKHEDVRAVLPTVEAPDPEAIVQWTKPDIEKLLAVSTLPHDRFGLYLVAFLSGLRAGEIRGLTFEHIALDAPIPYLRVRQQRGLARAAGEKATTGTPKTKSGKRDLPLHPAALVWLRWWRDEGWAARFGRVRSDESPVFPAIDGEAGRPRDANILRRDLVAAKLPLDFTTPDGEKIPYTFHATRRTFSKLLADNSVSVEIIGMLAGHAGKTVTERHYMGRSLEAMARAVTTIKLALPERDGVESCPPESSRESSQTETDQEDEGAILAGFPLLRQEQPIELPQLRHSHDAHDVDTHETGENKANGARSDVAAIVTNRDVNERMNALVFAAGTQWDETKTDPVELALAKALERTTDPAAIVAIVKELEARRARR